MYYIHIDDHQPFHLYTDKYLRDIPPREAGTMRGVMNELTSKHLPKMLTFLVVNESDKVVMRGYIDRRNINE